MRLIALMLTTLVLAFSLRPSLCLADPITLTDEEQATISAAIKKGAKCCSREVECSCHDEMITPEPPKPDRWAPWVDRAVGFAAGVVTAGVLVLAAKAVK